MDSLQATSASNPNQPKLLSRVNNFIRDKPYNLRTEDAYVYRIQ